MSKSVEYDSTDNTFFNLVVRNFELRQEAVYGRLPAKHPVSQWVNSFFQEHIVKTDDTTIEIIINDLMPEMEALATANSHIYISKGFLGLIDTEEELRFVLGHEYQHIAEKHHQNKSMKKGRVSAGRYMEYRADFKSFLDNNSTENPYGGLIFLKKLSMLEGRSAPGLIHGRSIDRYLNLFWSTKILDIESLTQITTPLPKFVSEYAQNPAQDSQVQIMSNMPAEQAWKSRSRARTFTLHQIFYLTADISEKRSEHLKGRFNERAHLEGDILKEYSSLIPGRIQEHGFTDQESTLLTGIILAGTLGVDIHQNYKIVPEFFEFLEEASTLHTVDQLLDLITEERFQELGCPILKIPPMISLTHALATSLLENSCFGESELNIQQYAMYAYRISKGISLLTDPRMRESTQQELMSRFFLTGIFQYHENDSSLREYLSAFAEYCNRSTLNQAITEAGTGYTWLRSNNYTPLEEIITLIDDVKTEPDYLYYPATETDSITKENKKKKEYNEWLDERSKKIIQILEEHALSKDEVMDKIEHYLSGHPGLQTQSVRSTYKKFLSTIAMIMPILDYYLGPVTLKNIPEHLHETRKLFQGSVPLSLREDK